MEVFYGLVCLVAAVQCCIHVFPQCNENEQPSERDDLSLSCDQEVEVAVVGAGPGGAYAVYKLRNKGLNIGLYEYSNIIGGRTQNYELSNAPDVNVQLGAMRYITDMHILESLIAELGLRTSVFELGFGKTEFSRYFLRGQNIPASDLKSKNGPVPYNLTAREKAAQDDLYSMYVADITGNNNIPIPIDRKTLTNLRHRDGRFLSELSYSEFLQEVASPEAKAMLDDSKKFQTELTEPTNVLFVLHDEWGAEFWGDEVMQIDSPGGMQAVPLRMVEEWRQAHVNKHQQHLNMQLTAIRHRQDGRSALYFTPTRTIDGRTSPVEGGQKQTVCARQTILAIPQYALMKLDWPPLKSEWARHAYEGVYPAPASKIYMTWDAAWWLNDSFTPYASRVTFGGGPTAHQLYDWEQSNVTGQYLFQVYSDGPNVDVQKQLQDQGETMPGSAPGAQRISVPLKEAIMGDLALVFGVNKEDLPEPTGGVAQIWAGYPFGGGWVMSRPGYNLQDLVTARRRPSLSEQVYVAGADYSFGANSGWSEGAFETMHSVLTDYFSL